MTVAVMMHAEEDDIRIYSMGSRNIGRIGIGAWNLDQVCLMYGNCRNYDDLVLYLSRLTAGHIDKACAVDTEEG